MTDSTVLKGNQRIVYRQLLKSFSGVVFVQDVCNFTDLSASQVRVAFTALIKKGLVEDRSRVNDFNQYVLLN